MTERRPKSVPELHPQSILTLSARPELHTEDDRSVVEAIERQIRRIRIARRAGRDDVALRLMDHLIDYVWGPEPDVTSSLARYVDELTDRSAGPDACWPWTGYVNPDGYGSVYVPATRTTGSVARFALARYLGRPIQPGLWALHKCDNRRCINPRHLYEGTRADNARDMAIRGRARNGHTKHTLGKVRVDGGAA